jgi:hypothetical protein
MQFLKVKNCIIPSISVSLLPKNYPAKQGVPHRLGQPHRPLKGDLELSPFLGASEVYRSGELVRTDGMRGLQ